MTTPEETEALSDRERRASYIGFDRLRYIERRGEPCEGCAGAGVRTYASTSTWRNTPAGQAFTEDVCDRCWGSGVEGKPWTSWREPVNVPTTPTLRQCQKHAPAPNDDSYCYLRKGHKTQHIAHVRGQGPGAMVRW